MSKTICPGQDTRYWRPGDIFEVKCGNCGNIMEFFKDEGSRRCSCGTRVQNPKLSMGCAQWCEHAKECLGYDPKEEIDSDEKEQTLDSLSERLINGMKFKLGDGNDLFIDAMHALDRAENSLKSKDANPMIVIAAVILLKADFLSSQIKKQTSLQLPVAREIMEDSGMSKPSIDEVCEIIENYLNGKGLDTVEYGIVAESYQGS